MRTKRCRLAKGGMIRGITAFILAVVMLVSCTPWHLTEAAETEWTEEAIENAWVVYAVTEWINVKTLNFSVSSGGSWASANVPDDFRTAYEPVIVEILSDCIFGLQFSSETNSRDHTEYKELILALAYQLNKKGESILSGNGFASEDIDICFINQYIDPTASITTVKESFYQLIRNYYYAERYWLIYHPTEDDGYSIYASNDNLYCVIQGVLYGREYIKEYAQYDSDDAKTWYTANAESMTAKGIPEWDDFAGEVGELYSAMQADTDHFVYG